MALTSIETAVERIRSGIDPVWSNLAYDSLRFALGLDSTYATPHALDDLPFYEEVHPTSAEYGVSRTLMHSIQLMVSRLLSNQIGMKVKRVPEIVRELMEQWLQERMRGDGTTDGGWMEEIRAAGTDGNSLGLGVLQIGLEDDVRTGMQKPTVRRVAPWYFISSPYEKNISRTPWICFVHHLSPEEAKLIFPEDVVDQNTRQANRRDGTRYSIDTVRLYEYFDLGMGGTEPTRILILGSLDVRQHDRRFKREPNKFNCLPFAVCTGWEWPVLRKPVGRIFNEVSHDKARRDAERRFLATLNQHPVMVVDENAVNAEDLELYKKGVPLKYLRYSGENRDAGAVAQMLPGGQVSENEWLFLQYQDRQQTKSSGISDLERGIQTSKRQTRTETLAVLDQGDLNKSFEVFNQTVFVQRFLEKLFTIAKEFDSVPFTIQLRGQSIQFNQPGVPESWLGKFLEPYAYEILVDIEALTGSDDDVKVSRRLARLGSLTPYAQAGIVDPRELAARHIELLGEEPDDFMLQQQSAPIPNQGGGRTALDESLATVRGGQGAA